jgi:hypothetical protein
MHNIPLALALLLSLAAGYAGVRLAVPLPPTPEASAAVAHSCRGYEMLHLRLDSFRAAQEFTRHGNCAAVLLKTAQ